MSLRLYANGTTSVGNTSLNNYSRASLGSFSINTNQITLGAWINIIDWNPAGHDPRIILKQNVAGSYSAGQDRFQWFLGLNRESTAGSPKTLRARFNYSNVTLLGTTPVTTNTWVYAAASFGSGTGKLYLNGVLESSNSSFNSTPFSLDTGSDYPVMVGNNAANSAGIIQPNAFNGYIASPAIWNTILTADELVSLSRGISASKIRPSNLVSFSPHFGKQNIDIIRGTQIQVYNTVSGAISPKMALGARKQYNTKSRTRFVGQIIAPTLVVNPTSSSTIAVSISAVATEGSTVLSYLTQRSVSSEFLLFEEFTSQNFEDFSLNSSTAYYYRSRFYQSDGRVSPWSETKFAITSAVNDPETPDELPASPGMTAISEFYGSGTIVLPDIPTPSVSLGSVTANSLTVSVAATPIINQTIILYEIQRSTDASSWTTVSSSISATFNNTGLNSSTTYFYRARFTQNDGRVSNYSVIKSSATLASTPPPSTGELPFPRLAAYNYDRTYSEEFMVSMAKCNHVVLNHWEEFESQHKVLILSNLSGNFSTNEDVYIGSTIQTASFRAKLNGIGNNRNNAKYLTISNIVGSATASQLLRGNTSLATATISSVLPLSLKWISEEVKSRNPNCKIFNYIDSDSVQKVPVIDQAKRAKIFQEKWMVFNSGTAGIARDSWFSYGPSSKTLALTNKSVANFIAGENVYVGQSITNFDFKSTIGYLGNDYNNRYTLVTGDAAFGTNQNGSTIINKTVTGQTSGATGTITSVSPTPLYTFNITKYAARDSQGRLSSEWWGDHAVSWIYNGALNNTQNDVLDGIFTDNFLSYPRIDGGDWNLDETPENYATKEATNWKVPIESRALAIDYLKGMLAVHDRIKSAKPNKLVLGNIATLWEAADSGIDLTDINKKVLGGILETILGVSYSPEVWGGVSKFIKAVQTTEDLLISPVYTEFHAVPENDLFTNYQAYRHALAACLVLSNMSFVWSKYNFNSAYDYDEYKFNLGAALEPRKTAANQNGIWRRDFQNGIVIWCPKGVSGTINLNGTFYRLSGTETPTVNNGQPVSSITFGTNTIPYHVNGVVTNTAIAGRDGLILRRTPN